MKTTNRGFIALMSAIIISAVLLLVATAGSLTGFYGRSNVLDSELKDRSSAAADACADEAFLQVATNPGYAGTMLFTLNPLDSCRAQVSGLSPNKMVRIQATSSNMATTNLLISYNPITYTVTSWQELAVF